MSGNDIRMLITSRDGKSFVNPITAEGIRWTTYRTGSAGRLDFYLVDCFCGEEHFEEGASVKLYVKEKPVFEGYVFTRKRTKSRLTEVTAFDQLRYLKNKDTYVYENITASELLKMIASDFGLQTGEIEDTGYKIAYRVEENTTLLDMLETALSLTEQSTGKSFVLFDSFGKLTLKSIDSMRVTRGQGYLLIDETSGENYEYTSSIDTGTYNKIKLTYDNKDTGKREVYTAIDSKNADNWGVLQYYDTLKEGENGYAKAEALLKLYNAKTRRLRIINAFGDCGVRAGSMTAVRLDLGDIKVNSFMLVEKAVHTFKNDEHFMELTLKGSGFNGL